MRPRQMNPSITLAAAAISGMGQAAETAAESFNELEIKMPRVEEYKYEMNMAEMTNYISIGSPRLLRGGQRGNQRQRRKDRRRLHAAGGKNAF